MSQSTCSAKYVSYPNYVCIEKLHFLAYWPLDFSLLAFRPISYCHGLVVSAVIIVGSVWCHTFPASPPQKLLPISFKFGMWLPYIVAYKNCSLRVDQKNKIIIVITFHLYSALL